MNDVSEETQEATPRKFGIDTVIADAKTVITDPVGFYRSMATSGGYAEPAIFVIVMGLVLAVLTAIFSLIGFGAKGAIAAGFFGVIFLPVFAVIGSFIGAAVMFVIWKLMGSEQNFEAAYRSVAHATAIYPVMAVVGLVPYIGTVIGVVWGFYLMFCASTQVHKIAAGKAKVVLGVIGVIVLLMQLSGEMATRALQSKAEVHMEEAEASMEAFGKSMEKLGTSMEGVSTEDMTPEEAGKAVGDFFRGMNDAIEKAEAQSQEATD